MTRRSKSIGVPKEGCSRRGWFSRVSSHGSRMSHGCLEVPVLVVSCVRMSPNLCKAPSFSTPGLGFMGHPGCPGTTQFWKGVLTIKGLTIPNHISYRYDLKNRKRWWQTGSRLLSPIGDRDPTRKFSIDRLEAWENSASTDEPDEPVQTIKEKSHYGNSVSTPHR